MGHLSFELLEVRRCTFLQAFCQGPEGRSLNSFGRRRRRDTFRQGRDLNDDINLREMFRVYETREEIPNVSLQKTTIADLDKKICLTYPEYYGLVITFLVCIRNSIEYGYLGNYVDRHIGFRKYFRGLSYFSYWF